MAKLQKVGDDGIGHADGSNIDSVFFVGSNDQNHRIREVQLLRELGPNGHFSLVLAANQLRSVMAHRHRLRLQAADQPLC